MFFGSWIINFTLSILAFLFVFIGSVTKNTFTTSLFRGCLAFVSFYVIAYLFRWLWKLASKQVSKQELVKREIEATADGKDTTIEYANQERENSK